MKELSLKKLEACPEFKEKLLRSGTSPIIEDTPNKVWIVGPEGKGMNLMGSILMKVREDTRKIISKMSKNADVKENNEANHGVSVSHDVKTQADKLWWTWKRTWNE